MPPAPVNLSLLPRFVRYSRKVSSSKGLTSRDTPRQRLQVRSSTFREFLSGLDFVTSAHLRFLPRICGFALEPLPSRPCQTSSSTTATLTALEQQAVSQSASKILQRRTSLT